MANSLQPSSMQVPLLISLPLQALQVALPDPQAATLQATTALLANRHSSTTHQAPIPTQAMTGASVAQKTTPLKTAASIPATLRKEEEEEEEVDQLVSPARPALWALLKDRKQPHKAKIPSGFPPPLSVANHWR